MRIFVIIFFCFWMAGASAQEKNRIRNNHSQAIDIGRKIKVNKNIISGNQTNINSIDYSSLVKPDLNNLKTFSFKIKAKDKGIITWLEAEVSQDKSAGWNSKIASWYNSLGDLLEVDNNVSSFTPKKIWTDELGQTHIQTSQFHNGIKIYNAEVILHSLDDAIYGQNGYYVKSKNLPSEKSVVIDSDVIRDNIRSSLTNFDEDWNVLSGINYTFDIPQHEQELVYYNHEGEYILAYHAMVYPHMAEHIEYIVDATDGSVILERSLICKAHNHTNDHSHDVDASHTNCNHDNHLAVMDGEATANATDLLGLTRNINTYDVGGDFFMIDASRDMYQSSSSLPNDPKGVIWTIDMRNASPSNNADYFHVSSENNSWNNSPAGVSAHHNAGQAYDYFKNVHGREAITGNGQNIISFINVSNEDGSNMGNAFWNGLGIFYGNGDSDFLPLGRGLDVAGHEMSHGVIQATANLEYSGESGAINEAIADIFGAMIDRDDWLIGEDVLRNGQPLRNMQNPHNNAQAGDFGGGWQPDNYDERYTGSADNGGVHINSGIINRAYYLFATGTSKEVAERVYYRALTTYLTRSSQFTDLRIAVEQSANDLYANDPNVVAQVRSAFDQVRIFSSGGTNYEQDVETNPGDDLLLFADPDQSNMYVINITQSEAIFDPLTTTNFHSKPSVTDDGRYIVFVGEDRKVHLIEIDYITQNATESILIDDAIWDNVVISKDASRIAATFQLVSPESDVQNRTLWVYDFSVQGQQTFELLNPTYSDGVSTGNVLYPDALEFDVTGNTVMYDALNRVNGSAGGDIEFWDIAFIEVWNPSADTWALGKIDKLFGSLPEGISIGNPTFSKNSPYIIALDYIEEGNNQILGVNIERGDVSVLFENLGLGYPSYSRDDNFLVYDLHAFSPTELGILQLEDDKISRVPNSDDFFFQNTFASKWGVWYSNGSRVLSDVEELAEEKNIITISPNPMEDILSLEMDTDGIDGDVTLEIIDAQGKLVLKKEISHSYTNNINTNVSHLHSGSYILSIRFKETIITKKFIKM